MIKSYRDRWGGVGSGAFNYAQAGKAGQGLVESDILRFFVGFCALYFRKEILLVLLISIPYCSICVRFFKVKSSLVFSGYCPRYWRFLVILSCDMFL